MPQRRILVVTGSRAEYGLLRWVMEYLRNDERVALLTGVTGMHLSPAFGLTHRSVEADGFRIDARVDMLLASDAPGAIAKSVGLGTLGFADAFDRLQPDIAVVLGDRFEILAAAQAAMLMRIPVAHVHGGEISEGAIDDSIRHSITKMASLHFVAAAPYRRRVIQLGESPSRVFTVGAPGVDAIDKIEPSTRAELDQTLGLPIRSPFILATYHPATLGETAALDAVSAFCSALDRFPTARVVVTKSNADSGGHVINAALERWVADNPGRATIHSSLGQRFYLSALRLADLVIGNSSSGLIEAPALRVPTVNIGPRQDGRLKAASVVDCAENAEAIATAIEQALSAGHAVTTRSMIAPYGGVGASKAIASTLASFPLATLRRKRFEDVPFVEVPDV